ncbi:hypothetical protein [Streptomyces coerulescens]|uniref:Uncharacterized protein n=1 Tax=Streptomyces coerulescens TaxID=29304 RepID=A0ABW0CQC7_STRCD
MTPPIDRIPVARSVRYIVRGAPEVPDEYNETRTIDPTEITLTYRSATDSQLGRIHVYVKGWWMHEGARVHAEAVGRHFTGDPAAWPEWLANEARLHDPERIPQRAVTRALILREAADFVGNDDTCDCGGCDSCVPNKLAAELRRKADEAQLVEASRPLTLATPCANPDCQHPYNWHKAGVCQADGCGCIAFAVDALAHKAQQYCAHCGATILRVTGTLAEWWVHDPGGLAACHPQEAASSHRAAPQPAAEAQQDEPDDREQDDLDETRRRERGMAQDIVTALGRKAAALQPDTETPTAYGDGRGRVFCVACPRPATPVSLTANDVDHWELCPSCGRHVVDVARAHQPAAVPSRAADDERAEA